MKRFLLPLALLLIAVPSLSQERKTFERTFPFTPYKQMKAGIRHKEITIDSVQIRDWPNADDFAEGAKDLNDKHSMTIEFTHSNRNEVRDYKCRYTVIVIGPDGAPVGQNDKSVTLDKGKIGETDKVSVKMKTHYYKKVKSFKVLFEIWPD